MAGKKFRIRYKRLFLFLIILLLLCFIVYKILSLKITNIYISGNSFLSDQEIIEMAKIGDYPSAVMTLSRTIEHNVISNSYVESAKVYRKNLTSVYITVSENKPLFYDAINHKTILKDGQSVDKVFNVPIFTSDIKGEIYSEFLEKFSLINSDVFNVISEVSYVPSDVDNELFLLAMNDGNYIYVNLDRFESINKYFGMVSKFNNHKGILYLDSGEYFKILDN